jgi:cytochrome c556
MNAIAEVPAVSAQTLEHVLGTGDLSKLTTQQRVEYYGKVCNSLGLNPLTRPFRFMTFNGQTLLYPTRDCTDQLRKINGIALHVVSQKQDSDLYIVTVRARDKSGREDEDMGAVTLGQLRGESRANALMKAMTKAKRRVTLSICGLGMTDESELDTMPGAYTFDAEAEPVPLKAAAASMPRGERVADPAVYEAADPLDEQDGRKWMDNLTRVLANAQTQQEVVEIANHSSVGNATANAPEAVKRRLTELLATAYGRFTNLDPSDTEPAEMENANA